MPGLVDGEFSAVWQADGRQQTPAQIGDVARYFDAFGPQLGEGGLDVVTHQVKLMTPVTVTWMNSHLGRRQREYEPAPARVDGRHVQHVSEERPHLDGVRGEDDRVHASDHASSLAVVAPQAIRQEPVAREGSRSGRKEPTHRPSALIRFAA